MIIEERFTLVRRLGEGAFGEVWLAADAETGVDVALKLLRPALSKRREVVRRFGREVEVLERVENAGLVRVVAAGTRGAPYYIAMAFVPGITLRDALSGRAEEGKAFEPEDIAVVVRAVGGALHALHEESVVHRDVKPANVMVQLDGDRIVGAVLLDLGVAKLDLERSDRTTVGRAMGTLMYMPPEQIRGDDVDLRADVFALGVLLFEMATLRRPFARDDAGRPLAIADGAPSQVGPNSHADVVRRIVFEPRARPSLFRRTLGGAFDAVVTRALEADPSARYGTVAALVEEADAALSAGATSTPRPRAETEAAPESMDHADIDGATVASATLLRTEIAAEPLTRVMPKSLTEDDLPATAATVNSAVPRAFPWAAAVAGAAAIAIVTAIGVGFARAPAVEVRSIPNERVARTAPPKPRVSPKAVDPAPAVEVEAAERLDPKDEPSGARAPSERSDPSARPGPRERADPSARPRPRERADLSARPGPRERADPTPEVRRPAPPSDPFAYDRDDAAAVAATAERLRRAARLLEDASVAKSIERCATLVLMRIDAAELERCIARYRAAER